MAFDIRYQWLAIVLVLVCTSCTNGLITPQDSAMPVTVTTSLGGVVVDQNGTPMAGVTVTAHGATTQTNTYGVYIFKDLSVPGERACVIARKNGYFTAAHAEWPTKNGTTVVSLTMQKVTSSGTVAAQAGGTVAVAGASVSFPVNAFALSNGVGYTGTVSVGLSYLTPDSAETFATYFSGDAAAQRTDNSIVQLLSYGVVRVQLTGEAGELLELRQGSKATITYPIPTILAASQPPTIPLWYFDETLGLWKEEGQAVRQGATYEGVVSHFTDWNCDDAMLTATLEGTVRCTNGKLAPSVQVYVLQRMLHTDALGRYRCQVPANEVFNIVVSPWNNDGMMAAPISVGPIQPQGTLSVDITVQNCPATVEGTIVDCADRPVGGFLRIESVLGAKIFPVPTGSFSVHVPRDETVTVRASTVDVQSSTVQTLAAFGADTTVNIGPIKACDKPQESYKDIDLGSWDASSIAFMHSGDVIAVAGMKVVKFYNASSATLERSYDISTSVPATFSSRWLMLSDDDSVMTIENYLHTTVAFQTWTGSSISSVSTQSRTYLSHNGTFLVALDSTGRIVTYDVATGTKQRTCSLVEREGIDLEGIQQGDERCVVTVNPSGPGNYTSVWDIVADVKVLKTAESSDRGSMCELSPDGRMQGFLSTSRDLFKGNVVFYDLITGAQVGSYGYDRFSGGSLRPQSISPNNKHYVAVRQNNAGSGFPVIMSMTDGSDVKVLSIPTVDALARAFAFDRTGARLAILFATSKGKIVRVYSL